VSRRGGDQVIPRPDVWQPGGPPPWLGRPVPLITPFPDARNSAVLVVLHEGDRGPELLFTRRSMQLRHHRGEVSFPGGRLEPGEGPVDAALREASEEVGLDPSEVEVVGQLTELSTVVSRSHIVPVVARLAGTGGERPALVPQASEVDRILWVELAELTRPDTYREERWGTPPLDRSIHFFELDDETIWGATARMLHDLLTVATA
jgi:8-oxo-dGTP pyrophosphatase MutT (NUDIX family)